MMLRRKPDQAFEFLLLEEAVRSGRPANVPQESIERLKLRVFATLGPQEAPRGVLAPVLRERWIAVPAGIGLAAAIFAAIRTAQVEPGREESPPAEGAQLASGRIRLDGNPVLAVLPGQRVVADGDAWITLSTSARVGLESGAAIELAEGDGNLFIESGAVTVAAEAGMTVQGDEWVAALAADSVARFDALHSGILVDVYEGSIELIVEDVGRYHFEAGETAVVSFAAPVVPQEAASSAPPVLIAPPSAPDLPKPAAAAEPAAPIVPGEAATVEPAQQGVNPPAPAPAHAPAAVIPSTPIDVPAAVPPPVAQVQPQQVDAPATPPAPVVNPPSPEEPPANEAAEPGAPAGPPTQGGGASPGNAGGSAGGESGPGQGTGPESPGAVVAPGRPTQAAVPAVGRPEQPGSQAKVENSEPGRPLDEPLGISASGGGHGAGGLRAPSPPADKGQGKHDGTSADAGDGEGPGESALPDAASHGDGDAPGEGDAARGALQRDGKKPTRDEPGTEGAEGDESPAGLPQGEHGTGAHIADEAKDEEGKADSPGPAGAASSADDTPSTRSDEGQDRPSTGPATGEHGGRDAKVSKTRTASR